MFVGEIITREYQLSQHQSLSRSLMIWELCARQLLLYKQVHRARFAYCLIGSKLERAWGLQRVLRPVLFRAPGVVTDGFVCTAIWRAQD